MSTRQVVSEGDPNAEPVTQTLRSQGAIAKKAAPGKTRSSARKRSTTMDDLSQANDDVDDLFVSANTFPSAVNLETV